MLFVRLICLYTNVKSQLCEHDMLIGHDSTHYALAMHIMSHIRIPFFYSIALTQHKTQIGGGVEWETMRKSDVSHLFWCLLLVFFFVYGYAIIIDEMRHNRVNIIYMLGGGLSAIDEGASASSSKTSN